MTKKSVIILCVSSKRLRHAGDDFLRGGPIKKSMHNNILYIGVVYANPRNRRRRQMRTYIYIILYHQRIYKTLMGRTDFNRFHFSRHLIRSVRATRVYYTLTICSTLK